MFVVVKLARKQVIVALGRLSFLSPYGVINSSHAQALQVYDSHMVLGVPPIEQQYRR